MNIYRTEQRTAIVNSAIQDSSLSFTARGLHHFLLSYSGKRELTESELLKSGLESDSELIAAVEELVACGYVEKTNSGAVHHV